MTNFQKALLFYNPKAGHVRPEVTKQKICNHFNKHNIELEVVEAPQPRAEFGVIVTDAIERGINLFVAAGGDGTVSFIGTHLVGKDQPLGIIPVGTGNLISKELHIPQNIDKALDLLTSKDYKLTQIDTIKTQDRFFLANISAGVSPKIMEKIDSGQKQRFGLFAYLFYLLQQLLGLKLERFYLDYDGQQATYRASEVLISNCKIVGFEQLKWSEDIYLDDGILNIYIIRAVNIRDLLGLILSIFTKKERTNPKVKIAHFRHYCRIETQKELRVQADGDCVGETPIDIQIEPQSLKIIAGR